MRKAALVLATLLAPLGATAGVQESAPTGIAIERTVKRTSIDWLDRDGVERSADAASEIPRRRVVNRRHRQPRAMKRALDEERTDDRQQDD